MPSLESEPTIGDRSPNYFIADISANHDGSFERARKLIRLAKQAGADAKFHHFRAHKTVSDYLDFERSASGLPIRRNGRIGLRSLPGSIDSWGWLPLSKPDADHEGIDFFPLRMILKP